MLSMLFLSIDLRMLSVLKSRNYCIIMQKKKSAIMEIGGRIRKSKLTNIKGDHICVCEINIYCGMEQRFYSANGIVKVEPHSGCFYCKNEVILAHSCCGEPLGALPRTDFGGTVGKGSSGMSPSMSPFR